MSSAGSSAVEAFLRPRAIAIIGISSRPGSAGMNAFANLTANGFEGAVYLVGRSGGEIQGRTVLTDADELPEGVDLAIFTLPAGAVHDAMRACVRRKVRAVIAFASGFAEVGERDSQDELAALARQGGVALLGPNCLGYTNYMNGLSAWFVSQVKTERLVDDGHPKVGIISASGGLMSHIRNALNQRNLRTAYAISTGNEAGIGLPDFINFFATDSAVGLLVIYVEEIRKPQEFLAAAAKALANGKRIVMAHPGRTDRAREAVSSHTGALAGDHAVMRMVVEDAGIMFIDNLDELVDVSELLMRYPDPPPHGPGVLTFSGAFCAIAHDFCDEIGLDLPPLSEAAEKEMRAALPGFATPRNPLDLTTQPVWQPDLMRTGVAALLNDPSIGSVLISIPISTPDLGMKYLKYTLEAATAHPDKPLVFSVLGESLPLPQEFLDYARNENVILSRSAERSLRALKHMVRKGWNSARAKTTTDAPQAAQLPRFGKGPQPEWLGKQALRAVGIATPAGDLARTADEAVEIAQRIGFPVAMKAQAARLAHKTEAGGVLLNVGDEAELRAGWNILIENVTKYDPAIVLDGALIEAMSKRGVEFVVGARRDPRWGVVLLVGLGGTTVEIFGDVRLIPPDLSQEAIIAEIMQLKTAALLKGFRGAPSADVEAIARVASAIGHVMRTSPEIVEIDVNPLIVHPRGEGVTALDALFVTTT